MRLFFNSLYDEPIISSNGGETRGPGRAPLIHSASLPGAPVKEVVSKGVVGQSTVPTRSQGGSRSAYHTPASKLQAPHIQLWAYSSDTGGRVGSDTNNAQDARLSQSRREDAVATSVSHSHEYSQVPRSRTHTSVPDLTHTGWAG